MLLYCITILLATVVFYKAETASDSPCDIVRSVQMFVNETNALLTKSSYPEYQESEVKFFLVTRAHRVPIQLKDSNLELVSSDRVTIVIVAGWLQGLSDPLYSDLTNAYLKKADYNIIQVDTSKLMFFPQPVSRTYSKPIGLTIGCFIVRLYRTQNISLKSVHIVGHSLGCQITAYAGQEVIRQTGIRVYRITGLDVGRSTYNTAPVSERLNRSNADVVDIVHTTGGLVGIEQQIGSVDFYPNGGSYTTLQPGCKPVSINNPLTKFNYPELSTAFCSHHKSYIYFAYSINTDKIIATNCSSYQNYEIGDCKNNTEAIFGENYVPGPSGKYYFNINCTNCLQCTYDY